MSRKVAQWRERERGDGGSEVPVLLVVRRRVSVMGERRDRPAGGSASAMLTMPV